MPGAAARSLGATKVSKEGLPVEAKPFSDLCKKVVSFSTTQAVNLLGIGKSMGGGIGGKALQIFNDLVGTILEQRYCNKLDLHFEPFGPGFDGFWGDDGPFVVYGPASNGNVWMQTWAINVAPTLKDSSEAKVGFAGKRYQRYTKDERSLGYFAQAELYFDCDDTWNSTVCNFQDGATYAIKWRARMRRLELPAIASGVVGATVAAITNLDAVENFKNAVGDKINDILGTSGLGRTALKVLLDNVLGEIQNKITDRITEGAGNFDPKLSNFGIIPYH
jgi:hypothetical protein